MAFSVVSKKSGKTYYLHRRDQERKGGGTTILYFFAGAPGEGAQDSLPDGYVVGENARSGLPILSRKK
jgi:hypothetical protein